ncbi:hypothetical protein C8R41DRAFT_926015 [Lentinula lateritia]|uniref:Uncharacterized protein n=1 Tax=Lentinula lateritia TaxID=40482 RepID=A0ABQ8V382_9AGAR|nr:hypothetical protein C8R41DRAFT_926015 [Lentinula lateritia]
MSYLADVCDLLRPGHDMSPPFPTAFQNADNIVLQVDGSMLMKNAYERSYRIGVDESDLSDMEDEAGSPQPKWSETISYLSSPSSLPTPSPVQSEKQPPASSGNAFSDLAMHASVSSFSSPAVSRASHSHQSGPHMCKPLSSPATTLLDASMTTSSSAASLSDASTKRFLSSLGDTSDAVSRRPEKKPRLQDPRNRQRAEKRAQERSKLGTPLGQRLAHERHVLPAQEMPSNLQSDRLPVAAGGFISVDADWYGAKACRELEKMKEQGFKLVEWQTGKSVPLADGENRVMVCMLDRPGNPTYQKAVEDMTEFILKAGQDTTWTNKEKRHKRGNFPALAQGISYVSATGSSDRYHQASHSRKPQLAER